MTNACILRTVVGLALSFSLGVLALAKDKRASEPSNPSYDLPQPGKKRIDANPYLRIREEGIGYSHAMEYASGLMDGIGARLTGSPNYNAAMRDLILPRKPFPHPEMEEQRSAPMKGVMPGTVAGAMAGEKSVEPK